MLGAGFWAGAFDLAAAAGALLVARAAGLAAAEEQEGRARARLDGRALRMLLGAFGADPANAPHAEALMPSLLPIYSSLDPETYGGAMLLGTDGVCIISHGSSSARAITNAVAVAREMVEADVVGEIGRAIRPSD